MCRRLLFARVVASIALAVAAGLGAQTPATLEPVRYTLRVADADKHLAGITARVPTDGRASITLMMPVWTPGYYVREDYASRVRDLTVTTPDGIAVAVSKPASNRWEVTTNGAPFLNLTYFANLILARAGIMTADEFLASMSSARRQPRPRGSA